MVIWWLGFIILFVLAIVAGIWAGNKFDDDIGIHTFFGLLVVFAVSIFIGMCSSVGNSYETNIKYTYENKVSIHSLEDNFKLNGGFVLGCGQRYILNSRR